MLSVISSLKDSVRRCGEEGVNIGELEEATDRLAKWNLHNLPAMLQYNANKGSIASGLNHYLAMGGGGDLEMEKAIVTRREGDEEGDERGGEGGFIRRAIERKRKLAAGWDEYVCFRVATWEQHEWQLVPMHRINLAEF